ncbi:MAG: choline-sulfatase [Glaciecola sp.]|jgi:choline-sulfatase
MSESNRKGSRAWTRYLLVLALPLLVACPSAKEPKPNILWIVVDTMRADRLGGAHNLTPYLDRLGENGAVFESAYSHSPWTLPSMASMLTSMHPKEHGAGGRLGKFQTLREGVLTAPAIFSRAGYQTHAIVNVEFLKEKYGVTRDFETLDTVTFENNVDVRIAQETTDAALKFIEEAPSDKPFFMFLHYFDVHAVYDPPQPFRRRYAAEFDREGGEGRTLFGTREHMIALRDGTLQLTEPWIERASRLYDGEIAYTDAEIGRLLDRLAALGVDKNTLIVFTSDHGEEFLDHGNFEHGHTVYDELIHVPMVMAGPGVKPGLRIPAVVRQVDILPTLCEWADVGGERSFTGLSLMPALQGEPARSRKVLSHGNMWGAPSSAWRDGDWKLIVPAEGTPSLFNMVQDPREQTNLATSEPERLKRLLASLKAMEGAMASLRPGADVNLSPEERDKFRGMGYSGGE